MDKNLESILAHLIIPGIQMAIRNMGNQTKIYFPPKGPPGPAGNPQPHGPPRGPPPENGGAIALAVICIFLTTIAVLLRVYARVFVINKIHIEDSTYYS